MADSSQKQYLRNRILNALAEGPVATPLLAGELGEDRNRIYRLCRKLEESGLLHSILDPSVPLLYCVEDDKIVTREEYEECKDHDLRSFSSNIRVWELTALGRATLDQVGSAN